MADLDRHSIVRAKIISNRRQVNLSKLPAREANALWHKVKQVLADPDATTWDMGFAKLIADPAIPAFKSTFGAGVEILVFREDYDRFMELSDNT